MRAAAILVGLTACEIVEPRPPPAELGTFPYHPLVYELDLAILAYQLHGQSLVWPYDPYYEEHAGERGTSRDRMMELVRGFAQRRGAAQVAAMAGVDAYRGPGVLAGFADAPAHDPIVYDYARLHPWSSALVNADDQWTEYLTPDAIVRRIRDVHVSARAIGSGTVEVTQLVPGRSDADPDAADVLLAFEGGTGDRGEAGQAPSFSLMGYVLVRDTGDGGYDLHVNFRGSRSGSAVRAALEALGSDARGNPDWITDLSFATARPDEVTAIGGVHAGFARSMTSILPALVPCLAKASALRGGAAPTNIYVTGHSLGGGLAQHFASAMLLGAGADALPEPVRAWPWQRLKLVTFSAPRAGDFAWAQELSEKQLASSFYDPGPLETVDADALLVLDPVIVARLHDTSRPAAFRVLISTDPISTTKIGGDGVHVGATVYVNGTSFIDWLGIDSTVDHEPEKVRAYMTEQLADDRTPPIAWRYLPTTALAPDRDAAQKGTPLEIEKLAAGLRAHYRDHGIFFDEAAFERDLQLRFAIERGAE